MMLQPQQPPLALGSAALGCSGGSLPRPTPPEDSCRQRISIRAQLA